MKKSEEYAVSLEPISEIEMLAKQIQAARGPYWKKPPTTEQAPSTRAALERQAKRNPKHDEDYWNRPLPPESEWKAERDAEKVFANTMGSRPFDSIAIDEGRRRKSKNELGQSELSSASPERREKAAHAFEVSGPAQNVDHDRIVGLIPIISAPPQIVEREISWVKALLIRLIGGDVWSAKKDEI